MTKPKPPHLHKRNGRPPIHPAPTVDSIEHLTAADFRERARVELGPDASAFAVKVRAFELRAQWQGIELASNEVPNIEDFFK